MMIYSMIIMMFLLLSTLILSINFILSKKKKKNRNKLTSFECGFDNISMLRLPFSIQFYLISIIFLIFDIEISLIFPIIKSFSMMKINLSFIVVMMILCIGLYYEWKEGSLKWLN